MIKLFASDLDGTLLARSHQFDELIKVTVEKIVVFFLSKWLHNCYTIKEVISVKLADNIRLLRKEKGLTQKQMGEQLNIPFRTIMNWERGVREPSSQNMVALEKFFNVSGSFLRGETDIREPMIWDDLDVLNSINNEFPQMLKRVLNIFEQEDEDNQHAIFTIISELQSILMSNKKEEKKKVLYMAMLNLKTINDTLKVNKTHD